MNAIPSDAADDSLMWWATRYVLGDLAPAEIDAWEARLLNEEAACLAVAEAARLILGLQTALQIPAASEPPPVAVAQLVKTTRTGRRTPAGPTLAMLLTSAVAVVFAASLNWSTPSPVIDDGSAVTLVEMWRDGERVAPTAGSDAEMDEVAEAYPVGDEVAVPNWLLAAVSLERSQKNRADDDVWEDN